MKSFYIYSRLHTSHGTNGSCWPGFTAPPGRKTECIQVLGKAAHRSRRRSSGRQGRRRAAEGGGCMSLAEVEGGEMCGCVNRKSRCLAASGASGVRFKSVWSKREAALTASSVRQLSLVRHLRLSSSSAVTSTSQISSNCSL